MKEICDFLPKEKGEEKHFLTCPCFTMLHIKGKCALHDLNCSKFVHCLQSRNLVPLLDELIVVVCYNLALR